MANLAISALGWIFKALMAGLLLGGLVGIIVWFKKSRQYTWVVRIYERDAMGALIEQKSDKGGIFLDKQTRNRLFLLKREKFGFSPDSIPYILNWEGKKVVSILRLGIKKFLYLTPDIEKEKILHYSVHDEDVAWADNAYERSKRPFQNAWLEKFMPFLGLIIMFIAFIGGVYMILDKGNFLADTAKTMERVSENLDNTAKQLSIASSGTTVIDTTAGGG